MEDVVNSQSPALCRIDRQVLSINIAACIGDYLSFIGMPNGMTEEATLETAQMMIDTHPHLTVDAIKTFFYECKRGKYGFHYNKMDGSKLLIWFDKFAEDYYKTLDDMQYAKHLNTKGDLANMLTFDEEGTQPIDYNELLASFYGKTKEQMALEQQAKDIRLDVQRRYMHLYDSMPVEEADKIIEGAIVDEMRAHDLLTF